MVAYDEAFLCLIKPCLCYFVSESDVQSRYVGSIHCLCIVSLTKVTTGFLFFFISIDKTNTIKAINRILSLPSPILVFAGFINLKVQGREGGDGLCA